MSFTVIVNVCVLGPCSSVGVHLNSPVFAFITAPVVVGVNEYVMASPSGSVDVAVNLNSVSSFVDVLVIFCNIGALFTGLIVIDIVASLLSIEPSFALNFNESVPL